MKSLPSLFRLAKVASTYSDHKKYKLGCVITSNGKPVSVGCNSNRTHSLTRKYHAHQTLHAEVAALLPLKFKKIKHGVAIVYRQDKMGNPSMARPCKTCQDILRSFGIKNFIYTTQSGWAEEEIG